MRNYLKKDQNMPDEYNRGVTLLRVGAALLIILILMLLSYIFVYSPPPLTYAENRSYTVVSTYTVTGQPVRKGYTYANKEYKHWLTIRSDDTGKEYEWNVKEEVLAMYTEGQTVSLPLYNIGGSNKKFISLEQNTDDKAATREYYKRKPTTAMSIYKWAGIITAFVTLVFLAGGAEQIAISGSHVYLPKEIPDNSENTIEQPNFDEIFEKNGKL